MKTVNRIRIFCIFTVLLGIIGYQLFNQKETEEKQIPLSTENTAVVKSKTETEEILPVSRTSEYAYVIVKEGDYLTVYHADRITVYEYTDILYAHLPQSLRQEIQKGYCIKNEAELFGFLENYSS